MAKRKRHVNSFLRSGLANSGRVAGIGVTCDDYSEQSFPDNPKGDGVRVRFPKRSEEEMAALNGPVIIYQLDDLSKEEGLNEHHQTRKRTLGTTG